MIDYNIRAERMGWLPSAPQLKTNPLEVAGAEEIRAGAAQYVADRAQVRQAGDVLRGPGRAGKLAAQPVRVALEPAGVVGQGARVFPQAPAGHRSRRDGQGPGRGRAGKSPRRPLARRGAARQARPAGDDRLPHVHHGGLFRHRAAHGQLVREERPQHLGHAPVHPPAAGGGGPGLRSKSDWEIFKAIAKKFSEVAPEMLGVGNRRGRGADPARHPRRDRARTTCATGRRANATWSPARPRPTTSRSSATIRRSTSGSPRSGR